MFYRFLLRTVEVVFVMSYTKRSDMSVVDLFAQLSDASNHLSRKVMGVFLHDVMQVDTSFLFLHLTLRINIALSASQGFPCPPFC